MYADDILITFYQYINENFAQAVEVKDHGIHQENKVPSILWRKKPINHTNVY